LRWGATPLDISLVFDRDHARRPPVRRLLAEGLAYLFVHETPPAPESLPNGRGRPVLVIPAFLTGDGFTADLRRFLTTCGFQAFPWGLGVNWGPTPRLVRGLGQRARELHRAHGPIALVGISLGGVLARDLAYDHPTEISHVVTLASPFRLPTASSVEPLVRLFAPRYSPDLRPDRLLTALPVPSTMLFTRADGVVAWDSCFVREAGAEVIEVSGAHLTLPSNPAAMRAIVRRLAET
jgi:hypothetical protein